MLPDASIANTTNDRAPDNCLGKDSSLELMYLVGQEETQSQKRGTSLVCKDLENQLQTQSKTTENLLLPLFPLNATAQIDMHLRLCRGIKQQP